MADSTYAVLVHLLPSDFRNEALALLPNEHIEKVQHDEVGLKIYFKKYSPSRDCITKRVIQVRGSPYTICPLVTNLTLHGIRKYASQLTIRDIMTPYGCVVNLYPVEKISKEGNFEVRELTDDYRVILGVPEVQINFTLSPLQLPDLRGHYFQMSFFCRLCRQNGHIQLQCPQESHGPIHATFHCSISQKEEVFQSEPRTERQRSSTGKGCCDNSKKKVRCSSNRQNGLQVSKEKISVRMDSGQVRVKEEQINSNVKSFDRFGYSQAQIKHAHSNESQNGKNYVWHEHGTQVNVLERNVEDVLVSSPVFCEAQGRSHTHPHKDFTSRTNFATGQSNMTSECVNCEQEEKIPRKKSKPSKSNNLPKRPGTNMWSRITPPNTSPEETKEFLISILEKKILNISQKVENNLRCILEWNHDRGEKYLKTKDRQFLKLLEQYLAKVSRNRTHSGHSEGGQIYQPPNTTDDQISGAEMKKKRQGVLSLCPGIEEIVLKTHGVIDPKILRNFLNQVRGRRKQMEIATLFEKDILALCDQLGNVVKSYYFYGERGAREDGDIDFIKRLQKRLIQDYSSKNQKNVNISQDYNSKNQKNVNYYNQEEAQTSNLEMASVEYLVESKKYSRGKNLPYQSSRIPKSSPQFYPRKLSEENFRSNSQRFSVYDRQCFKKLGTERKRRKNFRRINKNEITSEIRDDTGEEFETNFSFYGSRCTSGLNASIRNDSLEASAHDVETDKRKSNKRSSYTPHYSTRGDSSTHRKRNVLIDNPTTESQNVGRQPSSAEEVTKTDSREILPCAQQYDPAEEMSKEYLREILSRVNQLTEHSQSEENEGFIPE